MLLYIIMIYECLRCGFVAKQKGHHGSFNKNICPPTPEPISINEIKVIILTYSSEGPVLQLLQNAPQLLQNVQMTPFLPLLSSRVFHFAPFLKIRCSKMLQIAPKCSIFRIITTCEYCLRTYSKNSN